MAYSGNGYQECDSNKNGCGGKPITDSKRAGKNDARIGYALDMPLDPSDAKEAAKQHRDQKKLKPACNSDNCKCFIVLRHYKDINKMSGNPSDQYDEEQAYTPFPTDGVNADMNNFLGTDDAYSPDPHASPAGGGDPPPPDCSKYLSKERFDGKHYLTDRQGSTDHDGRWAVLALCLKVEGPKPVPVHVDLTKKKWSTPQLHHEDYQARNLPG